MSRRTDMMIQAINQAFRTHSDAVKAIRLVLILSLIRRAIVEQHSEFMNVQSIIECPYYFTRAKTELLRLDLSLADIFNYLRYIDPSDIQALNEIATQVNKPDGIPIAEAVKHISAIKRRLCNEINADTQAANTRVERLRMTYKSPLYTMLLLVIEMDTELRFNSLFRYLPSRSLVDKNRILNYTCLAPIALLATMDPWKFSFLTLSSWLVTRFLAWGRDQRIDLEKGIIHERSDLKLTDRFQLPLNDETMLLKSLFLLLAGAGALYYHEIMILMLSMAQQMDSLILLTLLTPLVRLVEANPALLSTIVFIICFLGYGLMQTAVTNYLFEGAVFTETLHQVGTYTMVGREGACMAPDDDRTWHIVDSPMSFFGSMLTRRSEITIASKRWIGQIECPANCGEYVCSAPVTQDELSDTFRHDAVQSLGNPTAGYSNFEVGTLNPEQFNSMFHLFNCRLRDLQPPHYVAYSISGNPLEGPLVFTAIDEGTLPYETSSTELAVWQP